MLKVRTLMQYHFDSYLGALKKSVVRNSSFLSFSRSSLSCYLRLMDLDKYSSSRPSNGQCIFAWYSKKPIHLTPPQGTVTKQRRQPLSKQGLAGHSVRDLSFLLGSLSVPLCIRVFATQTASYKNDLVVRNEEQSFFSFVLALWVWVTPVSFWYVPSSVDRSILSFYHRIVDMWISTIRLLFISQTIFWTFVMLIFEQARLFIKHLVFIFHFLGSHAKVLFDRTCTLTGIYSPRYTI